MWSERHEAQLSKEVGRPVIALSLRGLWVLGVAPSGRASHFP